MGISGSDQALMYALSGVMRAGASRAAYHSGDVFISIGGIEVGTIRDDPAKKVLMDSLEITDVLDETPNTCTMKVMGWTPPIGAPITVRLGSVRNTTLEFAGIILSLEAGYEGKPVPDQASWTLSGIDYTYVANFRKVLGRYQSVSASAIAVDIISRFTLGFTVHHVQAGLAAVDEITFTNQDVSSALTNLAKRIGAYWFIDYDRDLHFFTEETTAQYPDPAPIAAGHRSVNDVLVSSDLSQLVTEVLCEGGGSEAAADCIVGETILPIADPVWYPPSGTVVSGPQRITYASVQAGGGGALVGPSVSPSVAPATAGLRGSGLGTGAYKYAYTWVTVAGETLPSPVSVAVTTGPLPTVDPALFDAWSIQTQFHISNEQRGWHVGDTVDWAYSYATDDGPAYTGGFSPWLRLYAVANAYGYWFVNAATPSPCSMGVRVFYSPDPKVTRIYVWMSINGGPVWNNHPIWIGNNPANAYANGGVGYTEREFSSPFDHFRVGDYPPSSPDFAQVALSGIALGPSGVFNRKVYRTIANGSTLKLVATIANNTATTLTDAAADGALGANAPSSNSSGLVSGIGAALAGSTSIPVSGTAAFVATGGWAWTVNGQIVRYTSLSGTALLGIPASGIGALLATLNYGTNLTAAPALAGIPASGAGSIVVPIKPGAEVNVLAMASDLSIQEYLADQLGGDGVVQDYLQDGRLSFNEALDRATAHLLLKGRTQLLITYTCRDRHSRAGRTVVMDLEVPAITGLFKIQQVVISRFGPHVFPTYSVSASTERFSFEDLLRYVKSFEVS